jgi:glutaredoxin 3
MTMSKIRIYTTASCGYCHAAKDLLTKKEYEFQEVDVSNDQQARQAASAEAGNYPTVPMIFVGDVFVGGFTELASLISHGEFEKLVNP